MSIDVKLEAFEGPLDLLLHLIEKNKVDIYDIPIAEITDQYMAYVQKMREQDLDIVSEFLVMAATLLAIKAKLLLPPEVDEEGEEIDPREDLVRQLLEYKMYKYMSNELREKQVYAGKSMYRSPSLPEEVSAYKEPIDYDSLFAGVDMQLLGRIFEETMKRLAFREDVKHAGFGTIELEQVSVEEKMSYISDYARKNRSFSFRHVLQKSKSKAEVIVTFLSILELMKTGEIQVRQDHIFDDIMITSEIAEV